MTAQSSPESTTETFLASDGYTLHYRRWAAEREKPLAYILAVHGIQSHAGWYEASSGRLAAAGVEVWFADRRGSGCNAEDRGHTPHLDRLVNDVVQLLQYIRRCRNREAPLAPIVLQGISWGGKLASTIAARRPELVDALALLYPGLYAKVRPTWLQRWKLTFAHGLAAWFPPLEKKQVPIPLDDPALFTSAPQWQEFIQNDPLSLHEVTVSFLWANSQLDRRLQSIPDRLAKPTLVLLAGQDDIIDNEATREWLRRCRKARTTLHEYESAHHTLEFEPDAEQHAHDLIDWVTSLPDIL